MKQKPDSGFTLVEILLAIIAVAVVSFVGYYVYSQSSDTKTASSKSDTIKKQGPKTAEKPASGQTASWTPYSSKTIKFSFRYPPGWVKHDCDDTALLLGPTTASAGLCQSDATSQVQLLTQDGDRRTDYSLDAAVYPDLKKESVTVDGVTGMKQSGTLQTAQEIFVGPQNGSKMVSYLFYTQGRTYILSYIQTPEFTDVKKDFELLVTETFKFSD